ncbi:MAG: IPExxxVDY family protein [Thermaurantimonas sp.]
MKKHILRLDDSEILPVCLAIRSSSPDFEVAFKINSAIGICLERIPDHTLTHGGKHTYSFSTFSFDDEERMMNWYLLGNRSHPLHINERSAHGSSLFEHMETETYISLIPDKKQVDYWLLMDCESSDIKDIINQLKSDSTVSSVQRFDLKKSKFRSNLLLF